MMTVKGKCDGKVVRLEREVPVDGEVSVLVQFSAPRPSKKRKRAAKMGLVDFLLSGPTFTEEEIASIEEGRKEFRRWKG
jgi:hypothetical protein